MRKVLFLALLVLSLFSCRKDTKPTTFYGIDVSKNQGAMDWDVLATQDEHPIKFVLIRSTLGDDRIDYKFEHNLKRAREKNFVIGAYHYYDPNENSSLQADNYLKRVRLAQGDIIPIVDIERTSRVQSPQQLLVGLRNWLSIVEKAYGVKPIIYSASSWFDTFLATPELSSYPKWVAKWIDCNGQPTDDDKHVRNAVIWQYTDKLKIPGIPSKYTVDGNVMCSSVLDDITLR